MRAWWILLKKELLLMFKSPLAFVIAALFSMVTGWIFVNLLNQYISTVSSLPAHLTHQISIIDSVILRLFANMHLIILFICPILSMRMIAEEKKQNSLELLFCAPVKEVHIILAKFTSLCITVLFFLSLTAIIPMVLASSGLYETPVLFSGYFSIWITSCLYLAMGLFFSALTQNQIISAILGFCACLFLWMLNWVGSFWSNLALGNMMKFFSSIEHFQNIARGLIQVHDLAFYFFGILLFLVMTKYALEARNW